MRKTKTYFKTLLEQFDDRIGDIEPQYGYGDEPEFSAHPEDDYMPSDETPIKDVTYTGEVEVIKNKVHERDLMKNFEKAVELMNNLIQNTAIVPTYVNFQDELISIYFPDTGRQEVFNFDEIEGFCGDACGTKKPKASKGESKKKYEEDATNTTQTGTSPTTAGGTQKEEEDPNNPSIETLTQMADNAAKTLKGMGVNVQNSPEIKDMQKNLQNIIQQKQKAVKDTVDTIKNVATGKQSKPSTTSQKLSSQASSPVFKTNQQTKQVQVSQEEKMEYEHTVKPKANGKFKKGTK